MYVYVYIYIYICIYIYKYILKMSTSVIGEHAGGYTDARNDCLINDIARVFERSSHLLCLYAHEYVFMRVCVYVFVHACVCVFVCVRVYVYI